MPMVFSANNAGGDYREVPQDWYTAILEKIEEKTVNTQEGPQPRLQWHFRIIDEGDAQDAIVTGMTSLATGRNSTMRKWLKAFYRPFEEGEEWDLDDCIGKKCSVEVQHSKKTKDDGTKWCNVVGVIRDPDKSNRAELMEPLSPEEAERRAAQADSEAEAADESGDEQEAVEVGAGSELDGSEVEW